MGHDLGDGLRRRVGDDRFPLQGRRRSFQRIEVLDHHVLEFVEWEVAHHDHGHVVGPVPRLVVAPQAVGGGGFDLGRPADRLVVLVGRAGRVDPVELVEQVAVGGLPALAEFVAHDPDLAGHLRGFDQRRRCPLGEHVEGDLGCGRVDRGGGQQVDGLVVGGECVQLGSELDPELLELSGQFVARVLLRAVEQHVLEEVGTAVVGYLLLGRAGVDQEPQVEAGPG